MFENIRRIGIFMIAAQTVIHFAAGKQYEKYMKVITGVIILLMFVEPFVSGSENLTIDWQDKADQLEKLMQESIEQEVPNIADSMETAALRQIEEEVIIRLNNVIPDDDVKVTGVSIDLEKAEGSSDAGTGSDVRSWVFRRVRVTLQGSDADDAADTYDSRMIRIDEITVGHKSKESMEDAEQDFDGNAKTWEYQKIFAQTLGIADEKVEVIYRGEW